MNKLTTLLFFLLLLANNNSFAQVNYTANDQVSPYDGKFRYGTNFGYYPGWLDLQTADVVVGNGTLPGIGIDAIRGSLPQHFLEAWNYEIRVDFYDHYKSLGANDHLVFVGYPKEEDKDPVEYCAGEKSELIFKNMYEPIWDGGANGTPYNDENEYAAYLYKIVSNHTTHVKFWEITNEPDFTTDVGKAFGEPGQLGNWWDNAPEPCDMALKAPIYHYIRMLRISWEVIKTIDPTAYVTTGGLGNPAFLDAICRYTDNPNGGAVTTDYPLKGGAYFDVMSYHFYPHFDNSLRTFNGLDWDYHRNSDSAAEGLAANKKTFQEVMAKYGYDGNQYPKKLWLISETNVPRKAFNNIYFGSNEGQINYTIKMLIEAQKENLTQIYFYNVSDNQPESQAGWEFNLMGQLKYLGDYTYPNYEVNDQGVALKTTHDLLTTKKYEKELTEKMNFPSDVNGAVFVGNGDTTAIVWAKTTMDQSEIASATYDLPNGASFSNGEFFTWDFSRTNAPIDIVGNNIDLNGSPIFFKISGLENGTSSTHTIDNQLLANVFPNPTNGNFQISLKTEKRGQANISILNAQGKLVRWIKKGKILRSGNHTFEIENDLSKGLYFIKIDLKENGQRIIKLVIK